MIDERCRRNATEPSRGVPDYPERPTKRSHRNETFHWDMCELDILLERWPLQVRQV